VSTKFHAYSNSHTNSTTISDSTLHILEEVLSDSDSDTITVGEDAPICEPLTSLSVADVSSNISTSSSEACGLSAHRSNIRTNTSTAVGLHFNLPGHRFEDLTILPIQDLGPIPRDRWLQVEYSWMCKLKSFYPQGLNFNPMAYRK
jgi:hypothetical protein